MGDLRRDVEQIASPERVLTRPIELVMYAADASFYRLLPKAVVLSDGVEEIRSLFAYARRTGIPMTFRAAGTGLSGGALPVADRVKLWVPATRTRAAGCWSRRASPGWASGSRSPARFSFSMAPCVASRPRNCSTPPCTAPAPS
jgi:hypothetical protein